METRRTQEKYSLSNPSVARALASDPRLSGAIGTYKENLELRILALKKKKSPTRVEWTDFIGANTSHGVPTGFEPPLLASSASVSILTGAKGEAIGSVSLSPSPLSPPPPVLRPSLGQPSSDPQISRPPTPLESHPLPPSPPLAAARAPSSGVPALSQSLRAANSDPESRPPSPLVSHPLSSSPLQTPEQTPLLASSPPSSSASRTPPTARRPLDLSKYIYEKRPPFNPSHNDTHTPPRRSLSDLLLLPVAPPLPIHIPEPREQRDLQFRQVTFTRIDEDLFKRYFVNNQPLINTMKMRNFRMHQIEAEKISSWLTGFSMLLSAPDRINFEKAKPVEVYYALARITTDSNRTPNKQSLRSLSAYAPQLRLRTTDPASLQLIGEAEAKIRERLGT